MRLHFGFLRESISRNSGALVKTIGDEVMASFHDPLDALRAALDMHARLRELLADYAVDEEAVELKGIQEAVRIHRVSALHAAAARPETPR